MVKKLINMADLKTSGLISLALTPLLNLVTPVQHLFLPLIWLVIIDILSGIYKSRVINKKPITSGRLIERKSKIILIWVAGLLTMLLADKFLKEINITGNWGAKIYCVWYALYEVISILENLGDSGLPGAKKILELLRGKLPSNLDKSLQKEDNTNED